MVRCAHCWLFAIESVSPRNLSMLNLSMLADTGFSALLSRHGRVVTDRENLVGGD